MSEQEAKVLQARIEAYKSFVGARVALTIVGDHKQALMAKQAADELEEKLNQEHDLE